ncbi:MAG: hypothetical protein R6W88_17500, partial [Desulfobacterales bacterium]
YKGQIHFTGFAFFTIGRCLLDDDQENIELISVLNLHLNWIEALFEASRINPSKDYFYSST